MADQEIDSISVSFTADTSGFTRGAQQAADTLSELGQSAERAGEEAQGLTGVLDAINASLARIESAVNASTSAVQQMTTALSGISGTATAAEAVTQSVAQIGELSASAAGGVADVGEAAAAAGAGLSEVADGLQDAGKGLTKTEGKTDDCAKALEDMARQLDEARTRSDKLEAELSDLQEELDGIKDKAGSGDLFAGLAKGAAALGIGKLFKEAVDGAGELEQNIGGSASVFKEYAGTVQAAAKSAYESLGLSESKYLATATKMGALFQGTGSSIAASADMTTNAMKRAADVASIMGISIDDAMYSISGMAKGNFTMMDNLGVAMNDTTLQIYAQEKGLGKLETTQQKVNAAYQMFMDKTEYAARNYEKENATYAGSLTTLKAEFENFMAEAGTAVMPLVTQGIELLSGALNDLSPIITTVATGIGVVGDVIGALPEPLIKTAVYVITAAIAFKKLNSILSVTQSKFLLIASLALFVIGKISEIDAAAENAMNDTTDGAADGVNATTEAVDGLNSSLSETKKTLGKLAGFDEITKLSGSPSTLGASIVSADDVNNVADFGAEIDKATAKMNEMLATDTEVAPELDLSKVAKTLEGFGTTVLDALFGNEDEKYAALNKLNTYVEGFFGKEWSDNWKKVGQDMYDIINGFATGNEKSVYNGLKDLNEKIENIPFLGGLYKKVEDFYNYMGQTMNAVISGDWNKVVELSARTAAASPAATQNQKEALSGFANAYARGDFQGMNISFDKLNKEAQQNLQSLAKVPEDVLDFIGAGYLPLGDLARGWNDFFQSAGSNLFQLGQTLKGPGIVTGKVGEITDNSSIVPAAMAAEYSGNLREDPLTATDMMAIMGGAGGMMNGPLQINTTVEIDGEAVGRSVASYNNEQNYTSNGAAADR